MKSTGSCGYCGRQLPVHAPEGLCPSCLLKLGAAELGTALEVQDAVCRVQNEAPGGGSHKPKARSQNSEVGGQKADGQSRDAGGQRFGSYELLEKIGEGGMGVVYKARQINLDRLVALKLLPFGQFSREDLVCRFRAEATAAASLQHPNIVAIYDVGEHEGQHYFSMELVAGRTLGELVCDQPLPAKRAAAYLKTIAEAVHYAHQHSILHRDLKPSNVLIDASDQPRITDFGLAKRLSGTTDHGPQTTDQTLSGQVLGSPNFMAPEQAGGHAQAVGPASDVYSLGALLYHLLTRQPPFQADTLTTLLKQVVEAEPVAPRLLNPSIPRDLETICLKCLEKEPARRYSSSQALAEELDRFLEDKPIQARPVGAAAKAWKWCRRRPAMAGVTAALVLTFALGFGGTLWQWLRATRMARAELQQRQRAQAGEYAADMHLAQLAIADNNRSLVVALLDKHRPKGKSEVRSPNSQADLRGWEWRYLWQLCRGDEPVTLHRYLQGIRALGVSKAGDLVAVATGQEVALWNPQTGRHLTTLSVAPSGALAFSPVENLLAVGTWKTNGQPAVQLWGITAGGGTRKRTLNIGNHSLAFSPDGKRVAALDGGQGRLTIAECDSDVTHDFEALPLRYSGAGVVVFLSDADHLAIGQEYGKLELLDLKTRTFTPLETQTGDCISALAFCPATALLAAGLGYGNGTIQLWDVRSRELRGELTNHTDDIRALAFTADGRQLVSASSDWTIRIWDVAERTQSQCFQGTRGGMTALALLSNGSRLVSGDSGGSICFWTAAANSNQPLIHTNLAVSPALRSLRDIPPEGWKSGKTLDPKTARRFGLAFTADSCSFVTLDTGGTLVQWDTRSFQPAERLTTLGSNHWGLALSPDGHWLATGDHPDRITLYDWTTRQAVTNFTVPFEWFGLMRFSRSGRYFMADAVQNDSTHYVRIWRTIDWVEAPLGGSQFEGLWPVDLSPDDALLAAGYVTGAIKLFRFPSLELAATLTRDRDQATVSAVLFRPGGRELVSVDFAGQVRLWDVFARLELGEPLRGHLGIIMGAVLSPDDRRLATGGPSAKDAVKLWDLRAHREILSLQGEGHYFTHLTFSPDGDTLVATSLAGIAHLWRAPSWEEIAVVEEKQKAR